MGHAWQKQCSILDYAKGRALAGLPPDFGGWSKIFIGFLFADGTGDVAAHCAQKQTPRAAW